MGGNKLFSVGNGFISVEVVGQSDLGLLISVHECHKDFRIHTSMQGISTVFSMLCYAYLNLRLRPFDL